MYILQCTLLYFNNEKYSDLNHCCCQDEKEVTKCDRLHSTPWSRYTRLGLRYAVHALYLGRTGQGRGDV